MHKFILGENPQAPESGGLWIIHLPHPVAIIEVVHEGMKKHSNGEYYLDSYYHNTDGITEPISLYLYFYFSTEFTNKEEQNRLAAKMLSDAWHWYKAYLKWEDNNIDLKDIGELN